ncbi:MAG: 4-hydroxyphenylpyruvate dioxygenase [Candidatus Eisenbacteria bacterium]|nr:4-hydroxyphenylpyruvate dioxygenase [Candidatus Eisenbacteria bacterium]
MPDPLPIQGIHHVELVVGNARQAAYYYRKAFGFNQIAYLGPETGHRDRASYALEQNRVRLVLTTPLNPDDPLSEHIKRHGDGVWNVCFAADNPQAVFEEAVARGAEAAAPPEMLEDKRGRVPQTAIRAYGDVRHTFVETSAYDGPFLPGYEPEAIREDGNGLILIDHLVANVEDRRMNHWVDWYQRIFGFEHFMTFDDKDISTEYSALRSKVMSSPGGKVKLPINEPAQGKRKSQIQEYLDYYHSPGVQHIALFTTDIVETVTRMRERGVEFLEVPDTYYELVWDRVGGIQEEREDIRRLRILVDRDDQGYLLQLFTKPVEDRPTLFYEVIQRHGAQGFGKGNFKALFESIEREQQRRGNL